MCIRDSCASDRGVVGDGDIAGGRHVPGDRRPEGTARLELGAVDREGPRPVSYTHLRAHETVLDLVCRLLLETKKKKKKTKKKK